jgi:hypothetical protein
MFGYNDVVGAGKRKKEGGGGGRRGGGEGEGDNSSQFNKIHFNALPRHNPLHHRDSSFSLLHLPCVGTTYRRLYSAAAVRRDEALRESAIPNNAIRIRLKTRLVLG